MAHCNVCGMPEGCQPDAHPIDGIEMQYCFEDSEGNVEPCEAKENATMISVYYHLKDAGVDCVADFTLDKTKEAEEYAEFLAKKHNVQVDYC